MTYDCIVIGAGPAGLSAAINLNQRGKTVCVLSGGKNLLARAERVDNYLGFWGKTGSELMQSFLQHAEILNIEIQNKKAVNILPNDTSFMVNADGDILQSNAIILACGIAKAKAIPGENQFLGLGVSYCATCDGMLYRQKQAVVWGLAASAAEEAMFLSKIGVDVIYIAANKPEIFGDAAIRFIKGSVKQITGGQTVTGVILNDGTEISCNGIFILRDAIAPDKLIPSLETENGFVNTAKNMQTNIPGLYAAGDCTGLPLQVAKAVGEGLVAALSAAEYLDKA